MANEMRVCHVDDLNEGESLRIPAQGNMAGDIALHRVGETFYATDDLCTHEKWSLGEDGALEGHEIICCLHMAAFDVRNGKVTRLPATAPLKVYPVRVAEGDIWVEVDPR